MATATGFNFSSGTNSLFGAKTTAASTGFSFATSTAGIGFGSNTTTASSGLSFGAPGSTSGFSFGAPAVASSSTTGFSFGTAAASSTAGLFNSLATTTTSTGFSLFGAKTTAATSSTFSFGGFGSGPSSTGYLLPLTASTTTSSVIAKAPVNLKEETVPNELTTVVTDLETFIKSQKDTREEISTISSQTIAKCSEELLELKQNVALIANGLQRDSVAVNNLKYEVNQELKNAEIAHRIKDVAVSLQHEFNVPMEYFCRLVYSFEARINCYRKEIEELEIFLSTSSLNNTFSSQDLLTVLRRVNESFIGLASELQQVHEAVKSLKEKYLHFRRVVYNDSSDPFANRKKILESKGSFIGPSPFPIVQGAAIMASAFKSEIKAPAIGLSSTSGFGSTSSFSKSFTGLTRSLSCSGTEKNNGTSLFNKPTLGPSASLNLATPNTPAFMLQKPPSGKRGKMF